MCGLYPPPQTVSATAEAKSDLADVWLAGMMFDATRGASCLAILDGADVARGPVCRLWLRSAVPHGLHGCFTSDMFGLD